jgi:hypothetical protein
MTDRLRHAFSGRGSCSGRGSWTVVKFAARAEFDFSPDPDPMLYEKMRLPGRNRRTAARPASDPDALLTPPGIHPTRISDFFPASASLQQGCTSD